MRRTILVDQRLQSSFQLSLASPPQRLKSPLVPLNTLKLVEEFQTELDLTTKTGTENLAE